MITDFSNRFYLALLIFVLSCSPNSKTSKYNNALQKIEDTECILKSNLNLNKKFFVEKVICKNGYTFDFPDLGFDNENCRRPMKKIDGLKKPFFCTIDGETFINVY